MGASQPPSPSHATPNGDADAGRAGEERRAYRASMQEASVRGLPQALVEAELPLAVRSKIIAWCSEKGAAKGTELLRDDNFESLCSAADLKELEVERLREALELRYSENDDDSSAAFSPCGSRFADGKGRCDSELLSRSVSAPVKFRDSSFWQRQHLGRPRRVVFIRHGESEANVDRDITLRVPDHCLHLTAKGRQQALEAGKRLRQVIGDESMKFIVSPYVRAKETANGILRSWPEQKIEVREDVRIREQEYGNFDREDIKELHKEKRTFGAFYYRFPEGESPADCYDRASLFLESLYRSWEDNSTENLVIVGHGLMIVVVLMRFFRMPVADFETLESLQNCEFVVLERPPDDPKFDIKYTWPPGGDKQPGGLRKKSRPSATIWDGDPEAPLLQSVPVAPANGTRSSSRTPPNLEPPF